MPAVSRCASPCGRSQSRACCSRRSCASASPIGSPPQSIVVDGLARRRSALPQLVAALHPTALVLLAVGGVCYTVGAVFYVLKKIRYMHGIFHLWVLAGSVAAILGGGPLR
ncbi:MAG: hemolysin III family protein [Collinsella sp.]